MALPGYDARAAQGVVMTDPFDMPSQPQPGESDELELVYRDLKEATAEIERLKDVVLSVHGVLHQYRNDMMFPDLDAGQRQRRIEAIDKAAITLREALS